MYSLIPTPCLLVPKSAPKPKSPSPDLFVHEDRYTWIWAQVSRLDGRKWGWFLEFPQEPHWTPKENKWTPRRNHVNRGPKRKLFEKKLNPKPLSGQERSSNAGHKQIRPKYQGNPKQPNPISHSNLAKSHTCSKSNLRNLIPIHFAKYSLIESKQS